MSFIGKTERRVVLAILVTAIVPLFGALWLANVAIVRTAETAFHPEFGEHLERALGVYADLAKAMKSSMRNEAAAMAASASLQRAAVAAQAEREGQPVEPSAPVLSSELKQLFVGRPHLVSATIESPDGDVLAQHRREAPIDEKRERPFTVQQPVGSGDEAPQLTVEFAADRTRFDEMEGAQSFAQLYRKLAAGHGYEFVSATNIKSFVILLIFTVVLAVVMGIWVVRPVTRRINRMAAATRPVAAGDLSVRVESHGADEIADLARAFNQMLETLEQSRARIEFLNRIAEWQNMARRLAHEIKNPLTPIQLAVEECHRRYGGEDPQYAELLRTTVDIVIEEVAGLRRLVSEFAEFARLPRAHLEPGDLGPYLEEQRERLERTELPDDGVAFDLELTERALPVAFDREMLYRVLANLVSNAVQALRCEDAKSKGTVRLAGRRYEDHCELDVEDSGPGIEPGIRHQVFEPYRTTKQDGTGLGLTIVKKIVIDHGGRVEAGESSLGGARFRIRLPLLGTTESDAALLQSEAAPMSGPP